MAGRSTAALLDELCEGSLDVDAIPATELSGFHLRLDMSDTLAIAVSQSGTTTDTNRTVDLLRSRGAAVIGIVNRRASDLVDKADGILYTSDGRDVEMSVASTKAFYAQVAAGALLACAIAEAAGLGTEQRRHELLSGLRSLPEAMRAVLAKRDEIAEAARRLAPSKRYWAVVGNGPNAVAAEEVRIKLSELCYKSIASDITEDKKHIDLSSEPLILVCAAGLQGSIADDVAKETAIFKAHKATTIVVADEGETRFSANATITVPRVDPALGFVLSAMVGHLFGYEAALAIDGSARPLRETRELIERSAAEHVGGDAVLAAIRAEAPTLVRPFENGLRERSYDGHLEASSAVRLVGLLRDLSAPNPVETYAASSGKVGTPEALDRRTRRGVDAGDRRAHAPGRCDQTSGQDRHRRHLAKRRGCTRPDVGAGHIAVRGRSRRAQLPHAQGARRSLAGRRRGRRLHSLQHRRRHDRDRRSGRGISRTSAAASTPTRDWSAPNTGWLQREVLVARGRRDQRTVIFVPEVKAGTCTGITLLHVRLVDRLPSAQMRSVLQGYDNRFDRLVDWVSETEDQFDESLLAELPVAGLLIDPISDAADHWQS